MLIAIHETRQIIATTYICYAFHNRISWIFLSFYHHTFYTLRILPFNFSIVLLCWKHQIFWYMQKTHAKLDFLPLQLSLLNIFFAVCHISKTTFSSLPIDVIILTDKWSDVRDNRTWISVRHWPFQWHLLVHPHIYAKAFFNVATNTCTRPLFKDYLFS